MSATFDPTVPLDPAPDPWVASGMPSLRDRPPYHMTEMIEVQPHLARRILARLGEEGEAAHLAAAIRDAAHAHHPVVVTGCGTSEHAALAVTEILREALRSAGLPAGPTAVVPAQAFEAALDPQDGGVIVGVSHEGGTAATIRALEAARDNGATTALITAAAHSPAAGAADIVLSTGELDRSWCHVIGYLSPVLAGVAVAGHLTGRQGSTDAVANLIASGTALGSAAEPIAARLADAGRLLVVASGSDRPAGRELVLKIEEGSWLPSAYRDLETFLHGHLPATDDSTGLVLVLTDPAGREARLGRARQLLAAARVVGIRAAAIVAADVDRALAPDLTPAGRLVVPEAPGLPAAAAALLGSAAPLQLLAERLARARGTNPDPIRRDDPRYAEAGAAAE